MGPGVARVDVESRHEGVLLRVTLSPTAQQDLTR